MTTIIGVIGKLASGKDTALKYISECEKYTNYQVTNNGDKQKLFQQLDEIIKNIS